MSGNQTPPTGAGRVLGGRYRLVAPIARGGMAEVWEGYDVVLSRAVAVKVLQAHLAADEVFLERFRREAITAARLSHPGIVSTFDTGLDHGTAYIVMELVRGRNLRQYMSDVGPLPVWQAVAVARQVADALAYAHQAGLVHRDIKPANVLLVEDEWGGTRVKVTDFGIAKAGEAAGTDLTRTGMVLGTPKYLSPEQIKGEVPDARADLYSLGVLLFEMLAGAPPYVGETDMATALAHLNDRVPKVSSRVAGIPPGLDRLVSDLLAKDPDKRVGSAIVVRQRLDALGPLSGGTSRGASGQRGGLVGRRAGWGRGAPSSPRSTGSDGPPVPPATAPRSTPTGFPYGLDPVANPAPVSLTSRATATEAELAAASVQNAGAPAVAVDSVNGSASGGGGSSATGSAQVADAAVARTNGAPVDPTVATPSPGFQSRDYQGPDYQSPDVDRPGPSSTGSSSTGSSSTGSSSTGSSSTGSSSTGSSSHGSTPPPPAPTPAGRRANEAAQPDVAPSPRRFRRSERITGAVVVSIVAAGALVAGILLLGQSHPAKSDPTDTSAATGKPVSGVTVFMFDDRPPDDPGGTNNVIDGNASTYWSTDSYANATFGKLYPGIGLDIQLSSSATLHRVQVLSPTVGWTAQTYVSAVPIASGQPVSAWGRPTDTLTSTSQVTTFDLHGQRGQYVLFWLENLGPGPPYQARISKIVVS